MRIGKKFIVGCPVKDVLHREVVEVGMSDSNGRYERVQSDVKEFEVTLTN